MGVFLQTRLKLNPGKKGTKKLHQKYGDQLVCVRYRYDPEKQKRYKTVELIIDEIPWQPKPKRKELADKIVRLRIGIKERNLQKSVKAVGGIWKPKEKLWHLPYEKAAMLQLQSRIVPEQAYNNR